MFCSRGKSKTSNPPLPFLEIIQNFFPDIPPFFSFFFLLFLFFSFSTERTISKLFPTRALTRNNLTRIPPRLTEVDAIPPQGLYCRLWCYHDVPINRPFYPNGICMYFVPLLLFHHFYGSIEFSFSFFFFFSSSQWYSMVTITIVIILVRTSNKTEIYLPDFYR